VNSKLEPGQGIRSHLRRFSTLRKIAYTFHSRVPGSMRNIMFDLLPFPQCINAIRCSKSYHDEERIIWTWCDCLATHSDWFLEFFSWINQSDMASFFLTDWSLLTCRGEIRILEATGAIILKAAHASVNCLSILNYILSLSFIKHKDRMILYRTWIKFSK